MLRHRLVSCLRGVCEELECSCRVGSGIFQILLQGAVYRVRALDLRREFLTCLFQLGIHCGEREMFFWCHCDCMYLCSVLFEIDVFERLIENNVLFRSCHCQFHHPRHLAHFAFTADVRRWVGAVSSLMVRARRVGGE